MNYIKIFMLCIVCYILGCLQSYLGLFSLKEKISSLCMECSFSEEILYTNLILLGGMLIVSLIFKLIRLKKNILSVLYIVSFSIFSIIVNRDIFNAREASWSTYLDSEVTIHAISSLMPIIMMSWMVIFFMLKKSNRCE
ncbi:hypothetical protein CHRY9393_01297 [Chryseobacterium fistulae]|uniref:Uncharacterized protein n=1 Tax=Chryseobacterium fistulae TaxID=2675058 RepID=A0A6N4XS60_9FLAO|nr:hypothetical protein CHRY9393_01297 [Chryseobacterium fistulae]